MCRRLVTIVLLAACLGGCGFQLEGAAELAADQRRVYIQAADPYSPFVRAFEQRVRQRNGSVVTQRSEADVLLSVLADETGQRVLSVSARNLPRSPNVGALGDIDITTREECGGAVRVIASIEDPAGIKQILAQLERKSESKELKPIPESSTRRA